MPESPTIAHMIREAERTPEFYEAQLRCAVIDALRAAVDKKAGIPELAAALGVPEWIVWNRLEGRGTFTVAQLAGWAFTLGCCVRVALEPLGVPQSPPRTLFTVPWSHAGIQQPCSCGANVDLSLDDQGNRAIGTCEKCGAQWMAVRPNARS